MSSDKTDSKKKKTPKENLKQRRAPNRVQPPYGGLEGIVEMMRLLDEDHRKNLLNAVSQRDPDLAARIQSSIFTFDHFIHLNSREMQALCISVPYAKIALALRGASDDLKDHFLKSVSARLRETIEHEWEEMGPQVKTKIEEAKKQVLEVARKLERQGKLLLRSIPMDNGEKWIK